MVGGVTDLVEPVTHLAAELPTDGRGSVLESAATGPGVLAVPPVTGCHLELKIAERRLSGERRDTVTRWLFFTHRLVTDSDTPGATHATGDRHCCRGGSECGQVRGRKRDTPGQCQEGNRRLRRYIPLPTSIATYRPVRTAHSRVFVSRRESMYNFIDPQSVIDTTMTENPSTSAAERTEELSARTAGASAEQSSTDSPATHGDVSLDASGRVTTGETVIAARDLDVYYGETQALQNISIEIPERQVTALIGPSGCGKSTFLRSVNRMNDRIDSCEVAGDLLFQGTNVYDSNVDPVALRRKVGMVFQEPNPFPKSIYDNVAYGLRVQGYDGDLDDIVEDALRRAALWEEVEDQLDESGLELSGGQQQRLCIARAIATDPEVLLMDEPASALDPIATAKIEELVAELAAEYTVIVVTHNMQQAARISDRTAVFLTGGELVEVGDTKQIFEDPDDQRVADYVAGKFG